MLANLPKWTGDASNLSGLQRKRGMANETAAWESDPAAGAEAAFLDGGATDSEPEGITQPGERLRVYNLVGYGEPLLLSEVLISSKSLAKEAAALAFMRRGQHDIRPCLLLLLQAQDLRGVRCVLQYAENYLRVWCSRHGVVASANAISAAAFDGLCVIYCLREPRERGRATPARVVPATKVRAKELAMRDDHFGRLRRVVIGMLQDRYLEAVMRFSRAVGHDWERLAKTGIGLPASRKSHGGARAPRRPRAARAANYLTSRVA